MNQIEYQYEQARICKILINCTEGEKRSWCTECNTPCKTYIENRQEFWKLIKEKNTMATKQKIQINPGLTLPAELEAKLDELKNQQDDIDVLMEYIQDRENDEKLTGLNKKLKKIQDDIAKQRESLKIPENIEMLSEMQNALNEMLKSIGPSIDDPLWGPDAFSKGKKEAISSKDGTIVVLRTTRKDRAIIPQLFVETYPLLANKFVEDGRIRITLKEAEKDLGEDAINSICDVNVTHKYELRIKDGRSLPTLPA